MRRVFRTAADVFWAALGTRLLLVAACLALGVLLPDFDEGALLYAAIPALPRPVLDAAEATRDVPRDARVAAAAAHMEGAPPRAGLMDPDLASGRATPAIDAGLWHWDAVHYRHIADYGYTHEKQHAFFPLVPWLIRAATHTYAAALGAVVLQPHNATAAATSKQAPSVPGGGFMLYTLLQCVVFAVGAAALWSVISGCAWTDVARPVIPALVRPGYCLDRAAAEAPTAATGPAAEGEDAVLRVVVDRARQRKDLAVMATRTGLVITAGGDRVIAAAADALLPAVEAHDELQRDSTRASVIRNVAAVAVMFHIVSPAAVFSVASYTETVFGALTFGALLLLQRGRPVAASALFSLATLARSNGILHAGFYAHRILVRCVLSVLSAPPDSQRRGPAALLAAVLRKACTFATLRDVLCVAFIVAPFIATNAAAFDAFCVQTGRAGAAAVPPPLSVQTAAVYAELSESDAGLGARDRCPLTAGGMYEMIQHRYWGVGWFAYFTPNNIPNFLLALPLYASCAWALLLICRSAVAGAQDQAGEGADTAAHTAAHGAQSKWICSRCGKGKELPIDHLRGKDTVRSECWPCGRMSTFTRAVPEEEGGPKEARREADGKQEAVLKESKKKEKPAALLLRLFILSPHTVLLLVMLLLAATRMHVQVVTRFVQSCPAVYALLAVAALRSRPFATAATIYCVVWATLGVVLFPNFYPWT